MLWDIFCRVIDNFGDIGVCWRLSADLASRGHSVRLWVDDASALQWMAPGALEGHWPGVQVLPWQRSSEPEPLQPLALADVWIEAFGCDLPHTFVAHFVQLVSGGGGPATKACKSQPVWINLEYLSAEPYVERSHGLPSPLMQGPAKGWTKFFFYPGLSDKTGGLLREPTIPAAGQAPTPALRSEFFSRFGIPWQGERVCSLFCYEPPLLQALLDQFSDGAEPVLLLVTPGRASNAVQALAGQKSSIGMLQIHYLPTLTQADYDKLLANCDVNFVRGEDSVLRALWAGRPFVWQIYPQDDQAHATKLEAFMGQLQFGTSVRALHRAWNGLTTAAQQAGALEALQVQASPEWQAQALAARQRLFKLPDLTTGLLQFVQKNR